MRSRSPDSPYLTKPELKYRDRIFKQISIDFCIPKNKIEQVVNFQFSFIRRAMAEKGQSIRVPYLGKFINLSRLKTNQFLKKLRNIFEGWKNVIFESPEVEEVAIERAKICASCKTNINGVCSKGIKSMIDGKIVVGCGCPIAAKIRALDEECPKGKWSKHVGTTNRTKDKV